MSKPQILALILAIGAGTAGAQMTQPGTAGQQQQQQQPGANGEHGANSPLTGNDTIASAGMSQSGGANMRDKHFLRTAAEGGLFEVQAGQLASEKAANPQVKQFGQWMVSQHTQLNDNMKPFLQQANLKTPTSLTGKQQAEYQKLQGLQGKAFDKAYVPMMVKDHKKDLSEFQMEASQTQMPGLRNAVTQGQQMISEHLKRIEQISKSMKNGGSQNGQDTQGGGQSGQSQ